MSIANRARRAVARHRVLAHLNAYTFAAPDQSILSRASDLDAEPDRGPLHGLLVAIKDNICTTDMPTTAASQMLRGYMSPFDAAVVGHLRHAGAVITAKTNMDEFGMGSHSTNSVFGAVSQPLIDLDSTTSSSSPTAFSAGGSSGGSAVAVALGLCDAAIGTDTGGSVRLPAAYTGVIGFKPSYGLISRLGVIAYANSLDTVGILARSVSTAATVFDVLNRPDDRDRTSFRSGTRSRLGRRTNNSNKTDNTDSKATSQRNRPPIVVGVPAEYVVAELDPSVRAGWAAALDHLRRRGCIIKPVSLPSTRLALSAYYVLAPAEALSNLARYDGVRFGVRAPSSSQPQPQSHSHSDSQPQSHSQSQLQSPSSLSSSLAMPELDFPLDGDDTDPLYTRTRGHGFGPEVRRRIVLGTFSLSATAVDNYFVHAQRIRRLVQRHFDAVFKLPNPLVVDSNNNNNNNNSGNGNGSDGGDIYNHDRCDVLITPTAPTLPPRLEDVQAQSSVAGFVNDVFTVPASLAGLPALSIPVGWWDRTKTTPASSSSSSSESTTSSASHHDDTADIDARARYRRDMVGIQVIGQIGDDKTVLDVARILEGTA